MNTRNVGSVGASVDGARRAVSRRGFLGRLGLGSVTALFAASGISRLAGAAPRADADITASSLPLALPPMPYGYGALEPFIDEATMRLHHQAHHAEYVAELTAALRNYPDLQQRPITDLLRNLQALPPAIRETVRNNGGGHVNHAIFWVIMGPGGYREPTGELAQAINAAFGNFAGFKGIVNQTGLNRFGSGWAWLVLDQNGRLLIRDTLNQDSPYMDGQTPLLGVDVWEHSYYLRYRNRRSDYLNAWWNTVNWDAVAMRYAAARR